MQGSFSQRDEAMDPAAQLPSPARLQDLLFDACRIGRDDMISPLVEAGADIEMPDAKGHSPLVLASYHGHETTCRTLLDLGACVDGKEPPGNAGSALMGVAFKGYVPIARQLLLAGADPSFCNAAGQTPLMMAALFDRQEIVDLLLEAGAKPGVRDALGNDAASLALAQGNQTLARSIQHSVEERKPDAR
ncbi:ankyrin repeat domain-containing protein [Novosphingobium sp. BW1]|uniref:ankyrin repeat domain-containing protein n=1 Tax=Novosphingobium sp. BW1 TaxID=2592621 RepID=UPI0011DE7A81|nr:ankyrin repeat domain-containing protein [Novosphingobium sp. BW1]TYC90492.1 ankyrin repeat domain-containing protein [Novosphingobium sp. BW1]